MEELSSVNQLASYGALGTITIYLIYKDWKNSQSKDKVIEDNTTVMREFTQVLHEIKGRIGV